MHLSQRHTSWCSVKNILIIILVVFEVITFIIFNNKYNQTNNINNELNSTVVNQATVIQDLEEQNHILNDNVLKLEEELKLLREEKKQLIERNTKLEEEMSYIKTTIQINNKDFKSYMNYTMITNRTSKQWALQQDATTNEDGLRCIDGRPLVAIGTGWGLSVGDYAVVYCANNNKFEVVVGDIKDDAHTMNDNKTTSANSCRCEFIVDTTRLNQTVKNRGNVAVLQEYNGYVINIQGIK